MQRDVACEAVEMHIHSVRSPGPGYVLRVGPLRVCSLPDATQSVAEQGSED